MARKRMIDPEFWSDEKIALLPISARLLFIGLWNFSDDEGIFKARNEFIKNNIFPYDDMPITDIKKDVDALAVANLVFLYAVHSEQFGIVLNFKKHQVINKPLPSKHPKPSIQNREYQTAIFERDKYICHLCGEYIGDKLSDTDGLDSMPSIDHIIPQSKGGGDLPSNLRTACLRCNKSRGNRPITTAYGTTTVALPSEMKGKEMKGKKEKRNKMNSSIEEGNAKPSEFAAQFERGRAILAGKKTI